MILSVDLAFGSCSLKHLRHKAMKVKVTIIDEVNDGHQNKPIREIAKTLGMAKSAIWDILITLKNNKARLDFARKQSDR